MYFSDESFFMTRTFLQRGLALTYLIAFLTVVHQFVPLLGEKGLLPVSNFIKQVRFIDSPSVFFWLAKDWAFLLFGWLGVMLSLAALFGLSERFGTITSAAIWFTLWLIYLSFVNVGQTFYSFGWESLLLEAGFYAIFLGAAGTKPSFLVILLFLWLLFRIMFGAGLIKLRGDECWRDLTCMFYHYETQPMPNPLSWFFHWLPQWFHKLSVFWNHIIELVIPFMFFLPGKPRMIAGVLTIGFHLWLMMSGNFSFLGFITIVIAFATISDVYLKFIPSILSSIPGLSSLIPASSYAIPSLSAMTQPHTIVIYVLVGLIALLSIAPVRNLFSPRQAMNTSYNPLHLVGSYGAFGSITRPRYEVIVEGTDEKEVNESTQWKEYEFIGKPGDVKRTPIQVAPYHLRLDWLMWFAAFGRPEGHPWFYNMLAKFLANDRAVLSLIAHNPFPDTPPTFVRARLFLYRFTTPEEKKKTGALWHREFVRDYFPPVSLDHPQFRTVLHAQGWLTP